MNKSRKPDPDTAAADLAEVELTLQNILKGTGTYVSEL